MPTSTVENYVKRLYLEQQRTSDRLVPVGQLAMAMSVVPGTATVMVKALADSGLVYYESRQGVRLTPSGEQLALHMLRRHRLVELFLVKVLGMDWSEVHQEAEELEHAVSDRVLKRIDEILGHPTVDPHGDPIPSESGRIEQPTLRRLAECQTGESVTIARIEHQDPGFLRFVHEHGLVPGITLRVVEKIADSDAITVRPSKSQPITMGTAAANRILVAMPRRND